MDALKTLIPKLIADGHRVLLFSQWTQVLDMLQLFVTQCLKLPFMRFDGSTTVGDRQPIIDEFTADLSIPIMLITTRAGGLG